MNDLLRPSLYGAWQEIQAVKPRAGNAETWDIVDQCARPVISLVKTERWCWNKATC